MFNKIKGFIFIYKWNRTKANQYIWSCNCQPNKEYSATEHPLKCEWCVSLKFNCRRLSRKDCFKRAL